MEEPFDPSQLNPEASLNRTRILALSDVKVPADLIGKIGFELASAKALSRLMRERAGELELSAEELALPNQDLPRLLDRGLGSSSQRARTAARAVADEFAQGFAYLLLMLRRGYAGSIDVENEWIRGYRRHWSIIRTIVFGGGLLSGRLADGFCEALSAIWRADDWGPINFSIADNPDLLPLIGAARSVKGDEAETLTFDFGGSFVKRGRFRMRAETISEMTILPPVPTPSVKDECTETELTDIGRQMFDFMVRTILDTWLECRASGRMPGETIPVSVASYMRHGQPIERRGGPYAMSARLSPDVQREISLAVSERVKADIAVRLLHDGTAAAIAFAGLPDAAVIMLGTALGVGFVPAG